MISFFLLLFSTITLLLYPVSIKDDEYKPPRDNLELSVLCASQATAEGQKLNSFVDINKYCSEIIGKQCAPAGFTIEECYAVYFVEPDVKLPPNIVKNITQKIHGGD